MYKELIVDDVEELVSTVMSDTENIDIAYRIIAKYEEASAIVKELLQYEETSVYHLEIWNENWDGYDKEFLITIDDTLAVLCEPLYQDDNYLSYDSDKVFIMDGCSQKSVADCDDDIVTIVMYSDNVNESEDNENYIINGKSASKEEFDEYISQFRKNANREKNELSSSTSIYRVNGKQVDKATYDKAVNDIEEKYLDNMRDILLNYCEFMDEINEWRKLFCW